MTTKPSSLPHKWPHSTAQDLELRPKRIIKVGNPADQDFTFRNNSIKTSKYEPWNFLPKFLLEEFNPHVKVANCYFLLISGMQCIPAITNTGGYPTVLIPLSVVLLVSGVFKAIEDISRHKADTKANSSITEKYDFAHKRFKVVKWADVLVGDYIRVTSRNVVPADVILVQVSEPNPESPKGVSYVETKSLDGETNLKARNTLPTLLGKVTSEESLSALKGSVEMEHPNNLIDSFTGVLVLNDGSRASVQPNNVVLRGCVLRSTDWIVGLVVNTGHDVKIMQSSAEAKIKTSNLERVASKQIIGVISLLLVICFTGSIAQVIFNDVKDVDSMWYLDWDMSPGATWIIKFFYMLLLHASFIPVSLYVSMAIVRFGQAYFMMNDRDMYYEPIDCAALVRTMTLNEELGQVSHIFSDKTGTLTCNIMNFRKASIHGVSYGQGITEIGRAAWKLMDKPVPEDVMLAEQRAQENAVPHVSFYCPDYERDMSAGPTDSVQNRVKLNSGPNGETSISKLNLPRAEQRLKNKEFYKYIAICHEVVAEKMEGGHIKLSAPNPDDEALVCAAAYFGFEFQDRQDKYVVVKVIEKQTDSDHIDHLLKIEVLYTIAFTSARKRMSVIIRDTDGAVKIVTKGADSMMFSRVDPSDAELNAKTAKDIDQYSVEGLRCLVLAGTVIDAARFSKWSAQYDAATTDLTELDKRKRGEPNRIEVLEDEIESGLHVLGATAIEDRLQDGVPECVEQLAKAGIKIWVLTGDKEETAINIAVACNLVLPKEYMEQVVINKSTAPDMEAMCAIFRKELSRLHIRLASEMEEQGPPSPQHRQNSETPLTKHQSHLSIRSFTSESSLEMTRIYGSKENREPEKPRALIIDGQSLIHIMRDAKAKDLLLAFSQQCKAVVCCRVSPDQKREIVDMIKTGVPGVRTLAVGDGANDVAMITAAHIGVGIRGEEGVQAVNASDYAIGQFRYLSPLLLKHGRFNYVRMSNLISYMFYKNILMSSCMFWFSFLNAFSSQKYFTEGSIQLFNLFYTSIPILLYGAYDMDVAKYDALEYPQLYTMCINNFHFNTIIFWKWVVHAVLESVLCSILPLFYMTNFDVDDGVQHSFLEAGAVCFTIVIILVNLKLVFIQSNWQWFNVLISVLSVGTWIGVAYIINASYFIDFDFYHLWSRLLKNGSFWLAVLVICTIVFVKDLLVVYYEREVNYSPIHILQEINKAHGPDHISDSHAKQELNATANGYSSVQSETNPSRSSKGSSKGSSKSKKSSKSGSGSPHEAEEGEVVPFEVAEELMVK